MQSISYCQIDAYPLKRIKYRIAITKKELIDAIINARMGDIQTFL